MAKSIAKPLKTSFNTERIDHLYKDFQEKNDFKPFYGDLTDSTNILRVVQSVKPYEIYNLGAQSHVHTSFQVPEYTTYVNVMGSIKILEAVKNFSPESRFYNAATSELYGKISTLPWAVIFPNGGNISRHPSQIYEALLEGIALFVILNFVVGKKNFSHGSISLLFLILYGIFRIISEQFRQPDEHMGYIFGYLSMGSALSAIMIIVGALFLSRLIYNEKNR